MKKGMLLLAACLMLALSACGEEPGEAVCRRSMPGLWPQGRTTSRNAPSGKT